MIWTLIKMNVRAFFVGSLIGYSRRKKIKPITAIMIGLLVIYVLGALMFTFGAMFNGICIPFFETGLGWFYFALAGIIVFVLCFVGSVFMVQTQIFSAKDNELLLSMPIKPSAIVSGRIVALLIVEYLFSGIVLIPAIVVLFISGCISLISIPGMIFFVVLSLLLPLIALVFGCLIGWLVALVSSRMRNKNIPTLILSIALLIAYFVFYSRIMNDLSALLINGTETAQAVRQTIFPAYHYGVAIADGNILSFLIFTACAIIPFILMCILLSVSFFKLATANRGAKKVEYREKALRVSGARIALIKRELMQFWAQPMFILNAALGAIATVVIGVILIVYPSLLTNPLYQIIDLIPNIDPGIAGAVTLSALALINMVSAPTISLEGKRLWIVKSLPVEARDILLSKVGMHIAVCGIPAFLAGIVCIAVLPMKGVLPIVLTMVTPLTVTVFLALLGIIINLAFPRFDWINPVQPVKQGLSSMLTMLCGMALLGVTALTYVFLSSKMFEFDIYLLICTGALIAISAGMYAYLIGAGSRRFEALQ